MKDKTFKKLWSEASRKKKRDIVKIIFNLVLGFCVLIIYAWNGNSGLAALGGCLFFISALDLFISPVFERVERLEKKLDEVLE